MAQRVLIGTIRTFDSDSSIADLELDDDLAIGDHIRVEKNGEGFEQKVMDLRLEDINVKKGFRGNQVQIKLNTPAEAGSAVYKMV